MVYIIVNGVWEHPSFKIKHFLGVAELNIHFHIRHCSLSLTFASISSIIVLWKITCRLCYKLYYDIICIFHGFSCVCVCVWCVCVWERERERERRERERERDRERLEWYTPFSLIGVNEIYIIYSGIKYILIYIRIFYFNFDSFL